MRIQSEQTYVIDGKTYEIDNIYEPEDVGYNDGNYEIWLDGECVSGVLDKIPTEAEVRQMLSL